MKVLVTGAGGQLGQELVLAAPVGVTLVALGSAQCDVGDRAQVAAVLARTQPDVIINAAAYTAVDRAEADAAAAERTNARGPANLAAESGGARLLHVSTDFVFDGDRGHPWKTDDAPRPLSVYGRTKLAGEAPVLALGERGLVLRTSWVYSRFGGNFVKTMLRLMAERGQVGVVADQVGAPTWARGLADALWRAAAQAPVHGVHHWRDAGVASWYDLAVAIAEEALSLGLLGKAAIVTPIGTRDYPVPARRPAFSVLDCTASWQALQTTPPHWRSQLRSMLIDLKESHG